MHSFDLIGKKRFGPLFFTQFLGAFNDNFFKNALVILITFQVASAKNPATLVAFCAGIYILPFFLFSATAGQLADKYDKAPLIRLIKIWEILIMMVAALGFFNQNIVILLAALFAMGLHSTFFGPLKYSILPQHLEEKELVSGNGLIEMGTFLAILLGTIFGGFFIGLGPFGSHMVAFGVVFVAVAGWVASIGIPKAPSLVPDLKFSWNIFSQTWRIHAMARENSTVYLSILGISWFWFFGASFLTLLPEFTKSVLHGNESIVTLFLTLFSLGIGMGSILCNRFSGDKIELGLVPFGTIGMSFFTLDLFLASQHLTHAYGGAELQTLVQFISKPAHWHIMFDLFMISIHSGFFIVPLYSMIQSRSDQSHLSRIIAANNVLNAFFMVISSAMLYGFFYIGFQIPVIFLILALLNAAVALYIYKLIPEFLLRFIVWILVNTIYRLEVKGIKNIPDEGAALLVCNHVTFVDGLIISAASKRLIRFVVYRGFTKRPIMRYFFEKNRAIAIAPYKEDPDALENAFDEIGESLRQGDLICIFPEGKLTNDGNINEFRPGIEKIIAKNRVPVIPMALRGLWGSWFSRKEGKAVKGFPKKIFFPIALEIGEPIEAKNVQASSLQKRVVQLHQGTL